MYTVVKTKMGYAVQHTKTYVVVYSTTDKLDADRIASKLNG